MGPMLIAERKIKVYGRTDGGDGAAKSADGQVKSENMPEADTPCKWWNMAVPIASLVGYIFYLLAYTGQSGENDSFMKMMENSNSYQALLWGTMAAALTSVVFFFIQDKKSGKIIFFNVKGYANKMRRFVAQHIGKCGHEEPETESDEEVHAQVLLNYREAMSAFMMGMEKYLVPWSASSLPGRLEKSCRQLDSIDSSERLSLTASTTEFFLHSHLSSLS